ncbi:hypothetical protein M758_12G100700, partial [Ceratodon purpureus]
PTISCQKPLAHGKKIGRTRRNRQHPLAPLRRRNSQLPQMLRYAHLTLLFKSQTLTTLKNECTTIQVLPSALKILTHVVAPATNLYSACHSALEQALQNFLNRQAAISLK